MGTHNLCFEQKYEKNIFTTSEKSVDCMGVFRNENQQLHTGKCKSTGAGCNELVQSKLRNGVRLKWRKR